MAQSASALALIHDRNLPTAILVINWLLAAITAIVIGFRYYVRRNIIHKQHFEDYLIYVTLVLSVILSALVTVSVHFGLGQHVQDLMVQEDGATKIKFAIKYVYLSESFSIIASGLGRISYAFLLLNLIPPVTWRRVFLWTTAIAQFIFDIGMVVVSLAQCTPVKSFWEGKPQDCWDPSVQMYTAFVQTSFACFVDFALAFFPTTLFWNLNMRLSQKISLSILMGLGIFAMICTIIKTIEIKNLAVSDDLTFAMGNFAFWFVLSTYMVLIAVSIPTLWPLMRNSSFGSWMSKSKSRNYGGWGATSPEDGRECLKAPGISIYPDHSLELDEMSGYVFKVGTGDTENWHESAATQGIVRHAETTVTSTIRLPDGVAHTR